MVADIHALVGALPGDTTVAINPGSQASARVSNDQLRSALPIVEEGESDSSAEQQSDPPAN